MANYVIILAAGNGKRLGSNTPKCFLKINKKPIYQFSLELFQLFSQIKQIILVVPKRYVNKVKIANDKIKVVAGGTTRNESFELGLKAIKYICKHDKIIIHDAARINVQVEDIVKILDSELTFGTLCYLGNKNKSDLRFGKYNIQTPQFCKYFIYKLVKFRSKFVHNCCNRLQKVINCTNVKACFAPTKYYRRKSL